MKNKIIILFLFFTLLLTSGFGCKAPSSQVKKGLEPITLKYWRVYDDQDAFTEIINKYKAMHPFITIEYKKFRYDEYEKELINALAEDRGPDIFSIPSTWLKEYQNKMAPLPAKTTMVYPVVKGTVKKEVVPELRTTDSLTLRDLQNNFVDIVSSDVVLEKDGEKRIYGLPLYIDTLAMYYNRDLLNNADIAEPPTFWNRQFQQAVKKLTKQNIRGNIIQVGAGLGGSQNVERSSDILSLLMMQNGATMMEGNTVLFHSVPVGGDRNYNPGIGALQFYTDFANPAKEVYCWNSNLENSLDLFMQGNLAILFGYAYHLPIIKSGAPKLNFSIAKIPQIEGNARQINYANYWVETVSSKSKYTNEAWNFVQFATRAEQAEAYLKVVKKPTALRSLLAKQTEDLDILPFIEQVLTAESWYRGKNAKAAEKAIDEMIDLMNAGERKVEDVIKQGASKVQQTIN